MTSIQDYDESQAHDARALDRGARGQLKAENETRATRPASQAPGALAPLSEKLKASSTAEQAAAESRDDDDVEAVAVPELPEVQSRHRRHAAAGRQVRLSDVRFKY
ncbi:hypothetical protein ABIF99_002618 [Bradyrhizobium japonicum]